MRFLLIGSVVIIFAGVDLARSSAAAQRAHSKADYGPSCVCEFGYGGTACATAIACGIEGGRCSKSCVPPQDNQAVH
jgi:hypothetical protein